MSSSPSSVRSQVHWASGVKSLTTGLKSMSGSPASMRTICAWQLAISCSCWVLVRRNRVRCKRGEPTRGRADCAGDSKADVASRRQQDCHVRPHVGAHHTFDIHIFRSARAPRVGFAWAERPPVEIERSAASMSRRPIASPSGDDAPVSAGFFGVGREGLVGVEVQIALDGKAQAAAQFANLAHADEADLWTAEP
jgi:hypothetical protein